ncbi:MAG: hypothetical protein RL701_7761, partial [Pseudomonadota bacterium]
MASLHAQLVGITPEPTVSIRVLRGLVENVEMAGVSRRQLLQAARLDLDKLEVADARVPRSTIFRVCESAIDLTADPALGLHWAEAIDGTTFTPISPLLAHSATLRQGLEALSQFNRLLTDRPSYELHETDAQVIVRCLSMPGESLRLQRFTSEMLVTGLFKLVRSFMANARPERVTFEYAAPPYHKEYARIFETVVSFDQPCTSLVFDRKLMDATSPHKDDDVHSALRAIAQQRVLRLTRSTPYAVLVRELLLRQGPASRTDMKTVARALRLSVRSLRRRLATEGKTYNAITSDVLATMARQLLQEQRRTIQETAYEMGFSDTSTFHRAFKRWTGMTPHACQEGLAESED